MENIFAATDQYIESLFPDKDAGLSAAEQSIRDARIHDISVSPNQGRFLHLLATMCNAKRILEIGAFFGYSTIWLARALPKDGQLITIEYDETHAAIAHKNITNAGLGEIVDIKLGKALEILSQIASSGAGPFDMIFIDADKPPYAEYFQWALKLSRPGKLIVADNVIRHVFDPNTPDDKRNGIIRFNKLVAECPAVTAAIIQNVGTKEHDGMAIAVVN